jgi:hypothetical protein
LARGDLDNYPKLFPPARRAAARGVSAYDLTPLVLQSLKSLGPGTCGPAA